MRLTYGTNTFLVYFLSTNIISNTTGPSLSIFEFVESRQSHHCLKGILGASLHGHLHLESRLEGLLASFAGFTVFFLFFLCNIYFFYQPGTEHVLVFAPRLENDQHPYHLLRPPLPCHNHPWRPSSPRHFAS